MLSVCVRAPTVHTEKLCIGTHLEMILMTIDKEIHSAIFHLLLSICSSGLEVRVAASHPGGLGSIPGLGMLYWLVFTFYQSLGPCFGLGRAWASKRPFFPKTRGPKEPLDTEFIHGVSRLLGKNRT